MAAYYTPQLAAHNIQICLSLWPQRIKLYAFSCLLVNLYLFLFQQNCLKLYIPANSLRTQSNLRSPPIKRPDIIKKYTANETLINRPILLNGRDNLLTFPMRVFLLSLPLFSSHTKINTVKLALFRKADEREESEIELIKTLKCSSIMIDVIEC